ncbi:MAG: hypothetical protein GX657_05850 [Chloroflexi bacterium]|nr:hypothetical protein [Chloroflexota bacterium]
METRVVQCPKCGGSVEDPAVGAVRACAYCGAQVLITQGASGAPLGVLVDIKADTSFLAKERAREHLAQRELRLTAEAERILGVTASRLDAAKNRVRSRAQLLGVAIGLAVVGLSAALGSKGPCVGLPLAAILGWGAMFAYKRWKEPPALARVHGKYQPQIDTALAELGETRAEIRRLNEELDGLVSRV